MKHKMTPNSQLLTTKPKKQKQKLSPPNWNRNRTTEMEVTWRVISKGVVGGERGKGYATGNK